MSHISWDEIRKHETIEDCWIVFHDNVYDVTGFLEYHAGGVEEILNLAGRDVTNAFYAAGHSNVSVQGLRSLYVGSVSKNKAADVDHECSLAGRVDFVERQVTDIVYDEDCQTKSWKQIRMCIPISDGKTRLNEPQAGQVFAFRIQISDNKFVTRLYTPISWDGEKIKFAIKLYKDGKMSQQLQHLFEGMTIEVRGPFGFKIPNLRPVLSFTNPEFHNHRKKNVTAQHLGQIEIKTVLMIAAGSGITPMLPIIKHFCQKSPEVKMSLLVYANSIQELMCADELLRLKTNAGNQLKLVYGSPEKVNINLNTLAASTKKLYRVVDGEVTGPADWLHLALMANYTYDPKTFRGQRLFVVCGSHTFCRSLLSVLRDTYRPLNHEIELLGI
uniref:Cytochrome-b5 reductase n=1 Tax=Aplanochytrium stocchinoi TaxID=215587 RepID=A0A7S3PKP0_9STRA|mmetsp:Transcript_10019/g.12996  ORF Transcript_10019/g.12996 Transcript_10019/m.12996 type:complete len:386 (-) Transcript_10019:66-1223(-)